LGEGRLASSRSRVLGLLPCRWSGAPDLCAQIHGAAGFLLVGLELLWTEQTLARWDAIPLNKVWDAGYLLMQSLVEATIFLAGLGGEGEGRHRALLAVLLLLACRGGEEELKNCPASSASCRWCGPPVVSDTSQTYL
jgi:hypothetical protein